MRGYQGMSRWTKKPKRWPKANPATSKNSPNSACRTYQSANQWCARLTGEDSIPKQESGSNNHPDTNGSNRLTPPCPPQISGRKHRPRMMAGIPPHSDANRTYPTAGTPSQIGKAESLTCQNCHKVDELVHHYLTACTTFAPQRGYMESHLRRAAKSMNTLLTNPSHSCVPHPNIQTKSHAVPPSDGFDRF